MKDGKVGVGIIGTGFGRVAQVPGFRYCPVAEIVAICSGRAERAQAVAREHDIPHAFTDYREMLRLDGLDLVSIVTPPYLHYPMVMGALDAGKHVMCEKPMALDLKEAAAMYRKAQEKGVVHCIDHELRFNATFRKMRELVAGGYVGHLRQVGITRMAHFNADPRGRPWSWWFQKATGGGNLGAMASHYIDQMRWMFGEIEAVSGRLSTHVRERKMADSDEMRPVEADDACCFMVQFADGGEGLVSLSTVAYHPQGYRAEVFGDGGSLILDAQDRLWGARKGEGQMTEFTQPDPAASLPGVEKSIFNRSFVHLARYLVEAIKAGSGAPELASFYDGMKCQEVMDAVRLSWEEKRWVNLPLA